MPTSPDTARVSHACRICGGGTRFLGRRDGYAFVECRACAFWFTPDWDEAQAESAYAEGVGEAAPEEGWATPEFLAPAFEMLPDQPLNILDFGAGDSALPKALRRRGHRVVAVDLTPPREPHPDRLTGRLADLPLRPGAFDLVYAFQVFEHLPRPRPILGRLLCLARDGGLVVIHTDMEVPERAGGLQEWWYVTPPDHCSFYRHRTFRAYCTATGHGLPYLGEKCAILRARHPDMR